MTPPLHRDDPQTDEPLSHEPLSQEPRTAGPRHHEIVILGAGLSGIGAAMQLYRAGLIDFAILERADDTGGTWRTNVYPGVGVDVPSFSYQFSFERRTSWSHWYAAGYEIKAYLDDCVRRYRLRSRIRFGANVTAVVYDEERRLWEFRGHDDPERGDRPVVIATARYFINAIGPLGQPKLPEIPGLADFAGKTIHSAEWDSEYSLTGKRVAVIGTGATAVQIVPSIAAAVRDLVVYQRTPAMVFPKLNPRIGRGSRFVLEQVPLAEPAARLLSDWSLELTTLAAVHYSRLPLGGRLMEWINHAMLWFQVRDAELRASLRPRYGFYCKRPSVSNSYYPAFSRRNVELETAPIGAITQTGITTSDGNHREFDVLILATGFLTTEPDNTPPVPIIGRGGASLREVWSRERLHAYQASTVPGFPNAFCTFGPYGLTGAFTFMVEIQVQHAIRVIKEARRLGAATVEIKPSANRRYFDGLMRRQQRTVFFSGRCSGSNSYYFDPHGDVSLFRPSTAFVARHRVPKAPLSDYIFHVDPGGCVLAHPPDERLELERDVG